MSAQQGAYPISFCLLGLRERSPHGQCCDQHSRDWRIKPRNIVQIRRAGMRARHLPRLLVGGSCDDGRFPPREADSVLRPAWLQRRNCSQRFAAHALGTPSAWGARAWYSASVWCVSTGAQGACLCFYSQPLSGVCPCESTPLQDCPCAARPRCARSTDTCRRLKREAVSNWERPAEKTRSTRVQ